MMTLPGVGLGQGRVWMVRGSEVEVTTSARCDWGRAKSVDMFVLDLLMFCHSLEHNRIYWDRHSLYNFSVKTKVFESHTAD